MKEIFIIVLLIIGALIGAGFASGQEIYSFFYSYGKVGIAGIVLTFCLISLAIYKSLNIIYENEINSYDDFLKVFVKSEKITKVINVILNILLLVSFYIMIAGFGAYFEQELGLNRILGSLILAVLSGIVLLYNVKGVLKISSYIVPVLIIFIIVIGAVNLLTINPDVEIPVLKNGWLLSSISYCSYNIILLISVLISVKDQITKKCNIKYISIISGIVMMSISILIYMLLIKSDVDVSTLEMPVVYVISKFFSRYRVIYAFIILASIFTTAISLGIGFLQNISKKKKSYTQIVVLMCITSVMVSNFGFSKLVNFVYPIFGYIGILQLIYIYSFCQKKYCKKKVL